MRYLLASLFSLGLFIAPAPGSPPLFEEHVVWAKHEDGMITFHVPTIFVCHDDTVLAAADGRFKDVGDFGPHHLVVKRSEDRGKTWSANDYVARSDGHQIYLFPNFIQPRGSRRIFLFYSEKDVRDIHHLTHIWLRHSDDDGRTWSSAVDTAGVLAKRDLELQALVRRHAAGPQFDRDNPELYGRRAFFSGPGVAIQLSADNPRAPNRLIVPILGMQDRWSYEQQRGQFNTILISDDDGATWKAGGTVPIGEFPNSEPSIIELANGDLLFNIRVEHQYFRVISRSVDGGMTWTVAQKAQGFPTYDQIHSGLLRYSLARTDPTHTDRILFSFPAGGLDQKGHPKRENMNVWLSYDEHTTWPVRKLIHPGAAYYSNMALLADHTILLIYGEGGGDAFMPEQTVLARFNLEWLTDGKDSLTGGPAAK